jgi:histidine phosphotransferase ChpT
MQDKPDLAALIASRICHDLISPIGAIGNGVELLAMEPGGERPEMALISESVANANARIRFFRVCFGQAASEQRIARSEVTSILGDLGRGGRISYVWKVRWPMVARSTSRGRIAAGRYWRKRPG